MPAAKTPAKKRAATRRKPLDVNAVHNGDCVELLRRIKPGSVNLAFADPPFNIGYKYDVYDDRRAAEDYLEWSREWIVATAETLQDDGTLWIAIGDEFAAELKLIAQNDAGLHCRSWVIWYYTFGVNCKNGFSRSHTHLFHFVKDTKSFTFNADNPVVRVPSARQLVYQDHRANPKGRLPDNTWILRPQDLPEGFQATHDTWYFPRVAGTFKEREGFHGCQMPEQLLGRIIRLCSNPGDLVLDPFTGSGTTLVTAKKLGRRWIGTELSSEYVAHVSKRIENASPGDELDGVENPLASAPNTANGKRLKRKTPKGRAESQASNNLVMQGVVEAFRKTHEQLTVDQLLARPEANKRFVQACKASKLDGDAVSWNRTLLAIRKRGKLPKSTQRTRSPFTAAEVDRCSHAAEVAWQYVSNEFETSLDGIFCNPDLVKTFDELAEKLAPGYEPFRYRWAALVLRKRARAAQRLAETKFGEWKKQRLPTPKALEQDWSDLHETAGVYSLHDDQRRCLYVGESIDLKQRIESTIANPFWQQFEISKLRVVKAPEKPWGLQACLIERLQPMLNHRTPNDG